AVSGDCAHLVLICAALIMTKQFPRHQKLLWAIVGLGFLGQIAAQGRAALVGSVLGVFLMMVANRVRLRYLMITAVVLLGTSAAVMLTLPKEAIEHVVTTKKFSSNAVRQFTWKVMTERLTEDPLICVGWGNPVTQGPSQFSQGANGMIANDCASIFYYD